MKNNTLKTIANVSLYYGDFVLIFILSHCRETATEEKLGKSGIKCKHPTAILLLPSAEIEKANQEATKCNGLGK